MIQTTDAAKRHNAAGETRVIQKRGATERHNEEGKQTSNSGREEDENRKKEALVSF